MTPLTAARTLLRADRGALLAARAERRAVLEAHYREGRAVLLAQYQREMRPADYQQLITQ